MLDALEQALHDRKPMHRGGLVHHSDRGSQYVSIKYTERLAEAGIEPSVGSVGDSYDNALAETTTASTRPKSSIGADRGDRSRRSSSLPSNGWIGSTTGGSWSPSATFRRPKPRSATMPYWKTQLWRRDLNQTASGKPGAVHINVPEVGHVRFTIDQQGHLSGEDFWSNGKKTSGNTFYAIVVLADKDGKSIWSNKQTKGLDGSWFRRPREGRVALDYHLSKPQMEALDHVETKIGVMNCGVEVSEFHCCNNGIEITFTERKCEVPKMLRR